MKQTDTYITSVTAAKAGYPCVLEVFPSKPNSLLKTCFFHRQSSLQLLHGVNFLPGFEKPSLASQVVPG